MTRFACDRLSEVRRSVLVVTARVSVVVTYPDSSTFHFPIVILILLIIKPFITYLNFNTINQMKSKFLCFGRPTYLSVRVTKYLKIGLLVQTFLKIINMHLEPMLLKQTPYSKCNDIQEAVLATMNSAHQNSCSFSHNDMGLGEHSWCTIDTWELIKKQQMKFLRFFWVLIL